MLCLNDTQEMKLEMELGKLNRGAGQVGISMKEGEWRVSDIISGFVRKSQFSVFHVTVCITMFCKSQGDQYFQ